MTDAEMIGSLKSAGHSGVVICGVNAGTVACRLSELLRDAQRLELLAEWMKASNNVLLAGNCHLQVTDEPGDSLRKAIDDLDKAIKHSQKFGGS